MIYALMMIVCVGLTRYTNGFAFLHHVQQLSWRAHSTVAFQSQRSTPSRNGEKLEQLEKIRQQATFNFSTVEYPFRESVMKILEQNGDKIQLPLSLLHLNSRQGTTYITDKSGAKIQFFQSLWNKDRHLDGDDRGPAFSEFDSLYKRFIRNVIGPSLGGGVIIYQRAPTLRVYIPGDKHAMGKFHNDEQYFHQPAEINFWLPICERCFGTNSLWVETFPNKKDYQPIDLTYGQCFRGYLNQCSHGCYPNDTNSTRVSIDFRAISRLTGDHDPTFKEGVRRGPKAKFQRKFDVSGFYETMEIPHTTTEH